jgi:UDP-N-acetylmuramate--alanine ligase
MPPNGWPTPSKTWGAAMPLDATARLHFIGIGGIGMSGLAQICAGRGLAVGGCDVKANGSSHRLQARGIPVAIGHHPCHLDAPPDLVVYSAAVSAQEPELQAARARGIRTITRGELLAELAEGKRLIAVAGAHGKTTTSGLAAQVLLQAGWEPTIAVGGVMLATGTNAQFGRGPYLVAETDESDGSFLHLSPEVAIVTNIDREHLNHYRTLEDVVRAFQQFTGQISPEGLLIRCADDPLASRVAHRGRLLQYGFGPAADVTAARVRLDGQGSVFRAAIRGCPLGPFILRVPGRHNVLNALGVIALGVALEIPLTTIREALAAFQGTQRRFQRVTVPGDVWIVEDYAHHPAEIQATLAADTSVGRHRVAVFQPHRFTRTHALEREFAASFDGADGVIVTDIYAAFEPPIPGVSGERLAQLIRGHGHPCVRYVPKADLVPYVSHLARPGDTFFFLGAGDIGDLGHAVAAQLGAPGRAAR